MAGGDRYERLAALPEIGEAGLARIKGSRIALVGLGGLGCASAAVLAGSGVGHLKLIDPDVVTEPNLDRQLLYTPADVGRRKVEVAQAALSAQCPDLEITVLPVAFDADMLDDVQICLVGVDGLPAREQAMKAAIARSTPTIFGAVERFAGTVQTWMPGSACYGCVWGEGSIEAETSCPAVFGPAAHLIGTLQASEAMLICAGLAPAFIGFVYSIDLLRGSSRSLRVRRRSDCPVCGGF